MKLPRALYDQIKQHAIQEAPRECCGVLALQDDEVICLYRAANVAERSDQAFVMSPSDQSAILAEILDMGLDCAVYHSHPTSTAQPSIRDIRQAFPDSLHVIVGMGQGLQMTAWRMEHGAAAPVALEIT